MEIRISISYTAHVFCLFSFQTRIVPMILVFGKTTFKYFNGQIGMKSLILFSMVFCACSVFAQKNCNRVTLNFTPLCDLGSDSFMGYTGGLYPNGQNKPQGNYKLDIAQRADMVEPLDSNGIAAEDGKIVMIGVGASNPRTEFAAFQNLLDTFKSRNPDLITVNTCQGGQGVQKMNNPADNYWKLADNIFDSMKVHPLQVQIAWIETENTQKGDSIFPSAPLSLINDLKILLQTLKLKYPNLMLCYLSARAYSGWASSSLGKGLEHPRDYYNGWACKWLIDSAAAGKDGFIYKGNGAQIALPLYSTYMWTNKGDTRKDGFSVDCNTDIGADGLHLSAAGDMKLGAQILSFFAGDSSSIPWFIDTKTSSVNPETVKGGFKIYPNPAVSLLKIEKAGKDGGEFSFEIMNSQLQLVLKANSSGGEITTDISFLPDGIYCVYINDKGIISYYNLIVRKS